MRILIIEDTPRLREGIASAFRKSGYAVDTAADGEEGLWMAQTNAYDALVLDIMLPRIDGLEVLRQLRHEGQPVPILLLTARDTIPDRVHGLQIGADDYLIKPFSLEELLARVQVLCRRTYKNSANSLTIGPLTVDISARRATTGSIELDLAHREFSLLEYLALRQGQVVSRSEIEAHIYDERVDPMSNVVDAAVYSLRKKLSQAGVPSLIHTRRGFGYILEINSSNEGTTK